MILYLGKIRYYVTRNERECIIIIEQQIGWPVGPDLAIFWTLGKFLKPLATINLPKSPTFFGNFCKGVKIYQFSMEIIFGQPL